MVGRPAIGLLCGKPQGTRECSVVDWSGGNHDRWEQKNDEGLFRLCCQGQSLEMLNEEETGL